MSGLNADRQTDRFGFFAELKRKDNCFIVDHEGSKRDAVFLFGLGGEMFDDATRWARRISFLVSRLSSSPNACSFAAVADGDAVEFVDCARLQPAEGRSGGQLTGETDTAIKLCLDKLQGLGFIEERQRRQLRSTPRKKGAIKNSQEGNRKQAKKVTLLTLSMAFICKTCAD